MHAPFARLFLSNCYLGRLDLGWGITFFVTYADRRLSLPSAGWMHVWRRREANQWQRDRDVVLKSRFIVSRSPRRGPTSSSYSYDREGFHDFTAPIVRGERRSVAA
jgi:hypothetical protein